MRYTSVLIPCPHGTHLFQYFIRMNWFRISKKTIYHKKKCDAKTTLLYFMNDFFSFCNWITTLSKPSYVDDKLLNYLHWYDNSGREKQGNLSIHFNTKIGNKKEKNRKENRKEKPKIKARNYLHKLWSKKMNNIPVIIILSKHIKIYFWLTFNLNGGDDGRRDTLDFSFISSCLFFHRFFFFFLSFWILFCGNKQFIYFQFSHFLLGWQPIFLHFECNDINVGELAILTHHSQVFLYLIFNFLTVTK